MVLAHEASRFLGTPYLNQQIFDAQGLLIIFFPGPHRVDSCAQDLDGAIEVWPGNNLLLSLLDVANH